MSKKVIQIKNLTKTYVSFKKREGLSGSLKDFFKREKHLTQAVKSISFDVKQGEFLGFLGPNGAGKTTTLKMLTGILTPTSGEVDVLGYTPWKRKTGFKKRFSLVMGQKNQLWWDLPPLDSYELYRHMYEIPKTEFKKTLDFLSDLLDISDLIEVQTRKLSLGQRMKAELVGALLHKPDILFLDEPTIGLDVVSQKTIREFLREYNRETKATILLTSHYMEDIRKLCDRVMIIDHGSILYDGTYKKFTNKFAQEKTIDLVFTERVAAKDLKKFGEVDEWRETGARLLVPRKDSAKTLTKLMNQLPVEDVSVHEKHMDDIIRDIFTNKNLNRAIRLLLYI